MEKLRFYMNDEWNYFSFYGSVITDGQWHYITATRNGTTGESKLYVMVFYRNQLQILLLWIFHLLQQNWKLEVYLDTYYLKW